MSDEPITDAELAAWQAQAAEEGGERLAMYQRYYEPNEFEYAPLMAFPRLLAEVERLREKCKHAELSDNAHSAVRELLMQNDVPMAAFIDDHVGNAIMQRNQERERAEAAEQQVAKLAGLVRTMRQWHGHAHDCFASVILRMRMTA